MELIYVMKVEKKGRATETISDHYDHTIILSELFVKQNYLEHTKSKKLNKKQLTIIDYDVMITPDEVFEAFLENVSTDAYAALVGKLKRKCCIQMY